MAELTDPDDWQGFDPPYYTQVPDAVFDVWLARLSGAELKVLLYIIRRTFGFKKQSDPISLDQMVSGIVKKDGTRLDHGAGLARSSVQRAVDSLVARRLIVAEHNQGADGGDKPRIYSLVMRGTDYRYRGSDSEHPPMPILGTTGAAQSVPQETVPQETEIQEGINPLELTTELIALDKEIGGHNTYGLAQTRCAALCAARGWSVAQLVERLKQVRGGTILTRVATLE
jgi:phage replication O-like protein O